MQTPAKPAVAPQLAAASHARWMGDPARAIELLGDPDDAESLAELGRAQLALGRIADADRAFARAAALAKRGELQWEPPIEQRIVALDFTADGRRLVGIDLGGRISIWDVPSMRVVRTIHTAGSPRVFATSPNGRWVATGKEDTQVWDLATGDVVAEFAYAGEVAFTHDDRLVAAKPTGGFVAVDVPSKRELYSVPGKKIQLLRSAGKRLFATHTDHLVIYDGRASEEVRLAHPPKDVRAFGDEILAMHENELHIVRAHDGTVRAAIKGTYWQIATDGNLIAATTRFGKLHVFDRDGKHLAALSSLRNDALAFHPLGGLLAAADAAGGDLWNARTAAHVETFARPANAAVALAFDPSGERLAVGTRVGHAATWSLANGAVTTMTVQPGAAVEHVAFSAGGELATATTTFVATWDARGTRTWTTELPRIAWIGYRDRALATIHFDNETRFALWNAGRPAHELLLEADRAFHFTPDGAIAGSTNNVLVTVPLDGAPPSRVDLHHYDSARHGSLLAATANGGEIGIWDLARREPTRVLYDDNGDTVHLAWSADGKTLVSASGDVASLWVPATGHRRAQLAGPNRITALAMHPRGDVLATGHVDGRVVLWSLVDGSQIATLHARGELAAFATAGGAVDGTIADDAVAWIAGDVVLPARTKLVREPRLLAKRIATPRSPATLAGATPPATPATCVPPADHRGLLSSSVLPGGKLRVCLRLTPTPCFDVDLATGRYVPHSPSPREALGLGDGGGPTVELDESNARVCDRGTCRDVRVRPTEGKRAVVDDAGRLLAVAEAVGEGARNAVFVYDVATGKRLSQFIAQGEHVELQFLGEALLATTTPCAGPCSSSELFDARTGRALGGIPLNTSALSPARVHGNVWAFNDWDSTTVVLQDVKTGRVTRKLKLPKQACSTDPDAEWISCEGITMHVAGDRLVVLPSVRAGDVIVLDLRGKLVAEHALPVCR